jgi:hypothetical protein
MNAVPHTDGQIYKNKQPQSLKEKTKRQKELEQKLIFLTQKKIERIEEGRTFF